jgi:flagellar M-ring protein FliF
MFKKTRQQFSTVWQRQSPVQRFVLAGLVIGALVLAGLFLSWANTTTYGVAYSNLSEADAGTIVEKLEALQIPYQARPGGTILVPSSQVYDVRLRMAREGLPENSSVGFEVFSGNTLGMTEFTQRVNYQRALEGELERTIGSLTSVDFVQVHIVTPEKSLLAEDQAPTTASVTIEEKPGTSLDAAQVRSITHLVASSVEGLKPENVVVVDVNGRLLASGGMDASTANTSQADSRRAAEAAAATELQKKVQEILDKALGPNKSVVKASVAMDWTERARSQEAYDPAASAIRSSQVVTETLNSNGAGLGGIPGAMTNLPPTTGVITTGNQVSQYARQDKTFNYEISKTEFKEVEAPGRIERVSLSVLVDGVTDEDQLATLESIVAAAAGIDEARGDMLQVRSLAFDRTQAEAAEAEIAGDEKTELYWRIAYLAAGVIFLIAMLWYVQRLLNNLRLASAKAWTPVLKPVAEITAGSAGAAAQMAALTAGETPHGGTPQISAGAAPLPAPAAPAAQPAPEPLPEPATPLYSAADEQLQKNVIQLAEENPAAIAEIIQIWLNEDEK